MTKRPRLDPDLRKRVYSAQDDIDSAHREAIQRQEARNELIRKARGSLGQIAKRFGLSRPHILRIRRSTPVTSDRET